MFPRFSIEKRKFIGIKTVNEYVDFHCISENKIQKQANKKTLFK
jgi:hypothetical protein